MHTASDSLCFLGFCLPHAITYQALSSPAFQQHLCSFLPTPLPMKFRLSLPHAYMSLTSSASPHLRLQAAPSSPLLPIQLPQLFPCLQGAHHRLPTASSTTSQNHGLQSKALNILDQFSFKNLIFYCFSSFRFYSSPGVFKYVRSYNLTSSFVKNSDFQVLPKNPLK